MKQYLNLLQTVLESGRKKSDRTGTGTRSVFGHQMRFDLSKGFPIVTTKKVHFKSVVAELLWFLSGSTNVKDLQALGCTIWDEWAREDGSLGPIYGAQWRSWLTHTETEIQRDTEGRRTRTNTFGQGIDQISQLVEALKTNPNDRGHIVSAWNPLQLPHMALRPCHTMFQCYCEEIDTQERWRIATDAQLALMPEFLNANDLDAAGVPKHRISLQLYQRSADALLGVPFNISSYALLTHMLAQECNMAAGDFVWSGGDVHLYENHIEQAQLQLSRKPYGSLPILNIKRKPASIFEYTPADFELIGYEHHPAIKAPVAV